MNPPIFVRKAFIPNFRHPVSFLHAKKFMVGGWWVGVKTCFLVLSLKPKLNKKNDKNVFRFRVKMANFTGNSRGNGPPNPCPLCGSHSDIQEFKIKIS